MRFLYVFFFIVLTCLVAGCKERASDSLGSHVSDTSSGLSGNIKSFLALADVYEGANCTPDQSFCAYFPPTDLPLHVVGKHLQAAKKSIRIATYNMDVIEFIDILKDRLAAGVKIEYMVDYKLSFQTNIVWKSMPASVNLVRYRIPVMRGMNPQMHNKIIIIDDESLLIGSANWTYSGLVANYENVLILRDQETIKKYDAELDELRTMSDITCKMFATDPEKCGTGGETWPKKIQEDFLTNGTIPPEFVKSTAAASWGCDEFLRYGLFDGANQPPYHRDGALTRIKECFVDPKFETFVKAVSENEKFVDGTSVQAFVNSGKRYWNYKSNQTGPVRAYFSPEDNVEARIIEELDLTLTKPQESFAFVSTNFITNPELAKALVRLKDRGVHMKILFDRGRFEDPNFRNAMEILSPLGFTEGGADVTDDKLVTIFNNALTGPYACVHNKFAVVGSPEGVRLLTGSANWSNGAMRRNDENYLVIENSDVAALYLQEILSELFVYRYAQNVQNQGFQKDIKILTQKVPCLAMLLGQTDSCQSQSGASWNAKPLSHLLLSLGGVPINASSENLWAWLPDSQNGSGVAVRFYTHQVFSGRWLSSAPFPPKQDGQFKFFKAPKDWDPNSQGLGGVTWEYSGANSRKERTAPIGLHVIKSRYEWGQP